MDSHTEKLQLIKLLLETNNPKILDKIKSVFKAQLKNDIWLELTEKEKEELNNAIKEVEELQYDAYESFISNQLCK
jgi:DUF438 domain-containing protein